MNFKAKNCNMKIEKTRGPAAREYARPWTLVLAGTVALGVCSLPRGNDFIPQDPIAVVAGAESAPAAALQDDVETVLKKMEAAYDEVRDYQTEVEVIFFENDRSVKSTKCLYTFKKPKWIRLDWISPHQGMIMVYPDPNGKVLVKPQGLLSILTLHRMLDDPLLETPSGQRMNQTDMGLLIKNIRHSVTDQHRGPVSISEDKDTIQIQVLADDHFREAVETRYQFLISKELWLPVEVGKSTTNGVQESRIIFRNLRTNINVPDELFQ
jgi:outer membrane lipoprotein-sorting protein